MFADYLLIIPLFLAVALGWWLGRQQANGAPSSERSRDGQLSHEYFTGLDHLINEQTDEAIESFIRALEINSDTVPAHLTLAKLFRRKGDIERAVGIHQRLLARPDLVEADFIRIQMALAKDYHALGLLDRAENLLHDIMRQSRDTELATSARQWLIKLYAQEREWQSALDTAQQLPRKAKEAIGVELAHYCCELAVVQGSAGEQTSAEGYLREALGYDPGCGRVYLLRAEQQMRQGSWQQAINSLQQVLVKAPKLVPETIKPLLQCFAELDRPAELESYLRTCLAEAPSATVIMALAECIREREDVLAAGLFLTEELRKHPSIKGFNRLIDLHLAYGSSSARQSLTVLRGLTGQLEQSKPKYQCSHCGFAGRVLHWQCPSCKQWGVTAPIQGLEGE